MAKKKNSFIMYYEWEDTFSRLSDAQLGALLRAIYAYERRGEEYAGTDEAVRMSMAFVCPALDRNADKYRETCARRKQAVEKRWSSRGKSTPDTPVYNSIQVNTNDTDYEYEYDREYERERDCERESERDARARGRYRPPTAEAVRAYVRDNGLRVDVERYMDYYQARNWRTANGKPVDWQARLHQWDDGPGERASGRSAEEQAANNRRGVEQMKQLLRRMQEGDSE